MSKLFLACKNIDRQEAFTCEQGTANPRYSIFRGESVSLMQQIPDRTINVIAADPPYFLSNGGTTFHGNKRIYVHKGDWDKSLGVKGNFKFNVKWLRECQRILAPSGSIFVSGTRHNIFSVGSAMEYLGWHILNDLIWAKPAPPPNAGCRQFTDAHEVILWAIPKLAKPLPHQFNYKQIREANLTPICPECKKSGKPTYNFCPSCGANYLGNRSPKQAKTIIDWIDRPSLAEKWANDGKSYPAQKPVKLLRYLLEAVSQPGDLVLDPFMGSGATGVAAAKLDLEFLGLDLSPEAFAISSRRLAGWQGKE